MPVIGLNIKSIEAKKEKDIMGGGVRVKTHTDLKEVKEHHIANINTRALSIGFEFKTDYVSEEGKKELAKITINGEVLFVDEKYKEIIEKWKKDKALPEEVSIQVLNALLDKCSKKALALSDDLQLPSPIMLPFARKKEE